MIPKYFYHVCQLKRNPLHLKRIPVTQVNQVLDVIPRRFFNSLTLSSLHYVSIKENVFNRYFGHIPFYLIHELNVITWSPLKIVDSLNYYTVNRVYLINNNHVVILPNFTIKLI